VSLNLSKYKKKILIDEDKHLFKEVEKCAKAGAYRAAYIMTWIACAESLKYRFKEAGKRDHNASAVVTKVNDIEANKKSVDTYILNEAHKYGFVSTATHEKLGHILTFRSVYAHPYEEAPTEEELLNAISVVVDRVLSQPVLLKEGFVCSQVEEIINNPHFLDDLRDSVVEYAEDVLQRISEDCYFYMLEKLCKELENYFGDPTLRIFRKRGLWFSAVLVKYVHKVNNSFNWHDFSINYPKVSSVILAQISLFPEIGKNAQDSTVSTILERSEKSPTALRTLEKLIESDLLSKRQSDRFKMHIDKFNKKYHCSDSAKMLMASGLKIKTCFDSIVFHLKSHNWNIQNPVVTLIINNGINEVGELDTERQIILGRNILQAAEGNVHEAKILLDKTLEDVDLWPIQFVHGLFIECFVNEVDQFRFKIRMLDDVILIVNKYSLDIRKRLVSDLRQGIESSIPKPGYAFYADEIQECIKSLVKYSWGRPLAKSINIYIEEKEKSGDLEVVE